MYTILIAVSGGFLGKDRVVSEYSKRMFLLIHRTIHVII